MLTWHGVVRSMDFLGGEYREFDANCPVYASLVGTDHYSLDEEES